MRQFCPLLFPTLAVVLLSCAPSSNPRPGSVIFLHPDGTGLAHWSAGRIRWAGPDGQLAWDRLPAIALYRTHLRDSLGASSNAGGTIHAYGVKVDHAAFGLDAGQIPLTPSGQRLSLLRAAAAAGRSTGIINTGHLAEPGTACFLASVPRRTDEEEIVAQILDSQTPLILGGGESLFLPQGVPGRHGPGRRQDGRNLIAEARALGYEVVFNQPELAALPRHVRKVLGLFAHENTYYDGPPAQTRAQKLPLYAHHAPTFAEMVQVALRILSENPHGFFLVAEEEGTDNFSNYGHAAGMLEAVRRADAGIEVARQFIQAHPQTFLLVAADSEASGPQIIGAPPSHPLLAPGKKLPPTIPQHGTPLDGVNGPGSEPFLSAPDAAGKTHAFALAWASPFDGGGDIVVRADGYRSDLVHGSIDNTDIYRIIHTVLFPSTPLSPCSPQKSAP